MQYGDLGRAMPVVLALALGACSDSGESSSDSAAGVDPATLCVDSDCGE
ncbi:UNVERIFIED_CONTAM: hypothetical protein IGO34_31325, partial [Salmonella enterica subsp. enterica serovar Weltevreden]